MFRDQKHCAGVLNAWIWILRCHQQALKETRISRVFYCDGIWLLVQRRVVQVGWYLESFSCRLVLDHVSLIHYICFVHGLSISLKLAWWRRNGLQSIAKYLRLTLVFVWSRALKETFNRYFWGPSFWQGRWALGYHSMGLRHFPNIF